MATETPDGGGPTDPAHNPGKEAGAQRANIPGPRSGDDRTAAAIPVPRAAPAPPPTPPARPGPSALDSGKVTVTAFAAYFLMVLFLAGVLFAPHPPDLSKLGVSAVVTTALGVVVTPQNSTHDTWWWGLVALTVAGLATSGFLAVFDNAGHSSAAAVTAAFTGALSGLLTDGGKLRLPGTPGLPTH